MTRPPPPLRRGLAIAAVVLLSACQPVNSMDQHDDPRAGPAPEFKRNPNPVQAYEITARIEDAPGPFEMVAGSAQYQAPGCSYVVDPLAGAVANPSVVLPMQIRKLSETTFHGTLYLDAMVDEDYFESGTCAWELTSTNLTFKADSSDDATEFVALILADNVIAQHSNAFRYSKDQFPKDRDIPGHRSFGAAIDPSEPSKVDSGHFSVEITTRIAAP